MTFWRYLLFGCGQFGVMSLVRFFFQWIVKFPSSAKVGTLPGKLPAESLPDFVGESPEASLFGAAATVGAIFLGFRIFDAVTDPVAGVVSDAWVRRGRERRSLLWFALLLPSLGLYAIFAPDGSLAPGLRLALVSVGMFLFFVGYTFYAIPYWSLIDDYSGDDEHTRRVLSNVLGAGLLLATLAGFVVSGLLIERYGYRRAALLFALPSVILMTGPYFARPPGLAAPERRERQDPLAAFRGFARAFRHSRFLAVLLIFSGSQMSFAVMTSAAALIVERLLGGTDGDVGKVLGPFLLTALLSFALVPTLSRRLGWQRSVALASLLLGVVYAGTAFLGRTLVVDEWFTAGLLFALGGPMAAVLLGLEGEAVTACARETGEEVTSVYFGVFNLVIKFMNGVAIFITARLADLAAPEAWGDWAVRAMGFTAGGLLALGVAAYALLPKGPPANHTAPPA
ncbi:MAG: MFS transporter [Planctomycetota bacterium]|nr:MAG: MFS transporter [Planctomycetota bacterium]